jgi:hypothetical protein
MPISRLSCRSVVVVTARYYQDYSPRAFQLQAGVFRDVFRAIPLLG